LVPLIVLKVGSFGTEQLISLLSREGARCGFCDMCTHEWMDVSLFFGSFLGPNITSFWLVEEAFPAVSGPSGFTVFLNFFRHFPSPH
jgi:hypothetical protein